jgi:hypothetical protein
MKTGENVFEQDDCGKMEFVDRMRKICCWNLMEEVGCGAADRSGR